jgi:hypothetical protein
MEELADMAEAEKHYKRKSLYPVLLHLYTGIHREINETLIWEEAKPNEEFCEQRKQKRNTLKSKRIQKKRSNNNASIRNPRVLSQVPTRNYFVPLT